MPIIIQNERTKLTNNFYVEQTNPAVTGHTTLLSLTNLFPI